MQVNPNRQSRWYFGGLASAGAACITHPLDLLKVHLQTGSGVSSSKNVANGSKANIGLIGHVTKVCMKFFRITANEMVLYIRQWLRLILCIILLIDN